MIETINVPHADLPYEQRDISEFKNFDWTKATKWDAVSFARASGFKETGMSVNEVALLYDLLEKKGACNIVELGRNYGTSTRLFLQHVIRHGGSFESWDLKHWGNVRESFEELGFKTWPSNHESTEDYFIQAQDDTVLADIRIAHSIKTHIGNEERWVDFLLVDTEHGLEHALGEYMRWREYLNSGAMVAFHDSTLPGPSRAIEIIKEVEEAASPGANRIIREYVNERVDGYGIRILQWKD